MFLTWPLIGWRLCSNQSEARLQNSCLPVCRGVSRKATDIVFMEFRVSFGRVEVIMPTFGYQSQIHTLLRMEINRQKCILLINDNVNFLSTAVSCYPSNLSYKTHLSRHFNSWSLRCSWSIACRRCSNYIFILDLTLSFNGLDIDNCKMRRESFKFCDLVRLILKTFR